MGIIDNHSEYSLYDVVEGEIPEPSVESGEMVDGGSVEYMGFHVISVGDGEFIVQLDGHVGSVKRFDADRYDDVLELVDDLNRLVIRRDAMEYQKDKEELVEWAGKMVTSNKEKAEDSDLYIYAPTGEDLL